MKSIKIKLNNLNQGKQTKLKSIISDLELISKDYLELHLKELQSKEYKSFKEHYQNYRDQYPNLNSGIIQSQLRDLDSMVRSYISWCKKKHKLVAFPKETKTSIHLRNDMFHFEQSTNSTKFNAWLKFLRMYLPMNLCKYHLESLENMEDISDSSIYLDSNGVPSLRLVFKTKPVKATGTKVLGVDLGIVKPIVCSDGHMIGSGKHIKHKKLEFGKKRAKHQAHKQDITNKQSNWTDDLNHKLSRKLINYCVSNDIGVLALEKLSGSHLANRKFRRYSWAFKDLINKITYKALNAGLKVIGVDPRYTSQTCSSCGLKEKSNRIGQSLYSCSCGYRANADINAARNICGFTTANGFTVNQTQGALT
jgi:IS605 OrfB family transposase